MKIRIILAIILFILVINSVPSTIFSQQNTNNIQTNKNLFQFTGPEKDAESPSYFTMVIKTLLILGIFGICIYYFGKYISKKQGLSFPHLNIINIITSIPVGTNRFVQIIEVGNKYYLIGSTDSNINLLTEVVDKETLNMIKILKNKQAERTDTPTFFSFLNNFLGGISKKVHVKDNTRFIKKQKDRLKKFLI